MRYNDGLVPGGRTPRLYLAKGREVVKFVGENINGFCAIASTKYEKGGKWSNTTYELVLAHGVRALHFLSPLHQMWGDNFGSWGEVVQELSLPIDVAQKLLRTEYPRTAERLDKLEEFAQQQTNEVETVIISFGSPTNRAIREGYWEKPQSGKTAAGMLVTVQPNPDWSNPTVVSPENAKILAARHRPGMHGGYWEIEVAVS